MKRFISAFLSLVMAISLLAYLPIRVEAYEEVKSNVYTDWDLVGGNGSNQFNARRYLKENGTFNYRAWSQGQLPWGLYQLGNKNVYASFNNAGCLVTAFAKIAVQSGNYSVYNMDPGIMNELMQRNGCFQAGNGILSSWKNTAELIGLTYVKGASYSNIVSELKNDSSKQFIIYVKNSSGQDHYVPVNNEMTIKYGKVYVDNSGCEGGRTESTSFATAQKKYSTGSFKSYQQYEDKLVGKTLDQLGFTVKTVYGFTKGGSTPSGVTIESYKTAKVGITGDNWLYPAFKVTVPNYKNSKISTVGYSVYTASGDEMFRFQETYKSGVNKDGTSYKNTFFGARTDGEANMDLEKDVYNIKREYLTDLRFLPGHNYFVRGFVVFDGKRYESNGHWMKTTGIGDQHMYDDGYVAAEPTCIYKGVMKYICRMCGCSKTEPIPPKDHTPGAAATCTAPQKCTVCGTQLKAPLGHNYSGNFWYASHPHEQYQKCTRCSAEKKTGSTKKLDSCSICYPTFTITYNANGGSGAPASQTKSSGKALTLSSTKPTRQGYTFLGWATSSGASSAQYNAGGSFTTDANTTLYAVWRKDAVTTGAQIVVGNVTAVPGSTVMVPIEIKNNPGVMSVSFRMRYPNSAITLVDSGAKALIGTSVSNPNFGLMPYPYSWYRPEFDNFTGDAILATPKFKISQNAPEGIYDIVIEYDPKVNEIVDKNNQNINFEVVVGQITVSKVLCGDVDKNGVVNMLDGIAIMKYYNKWTGFETGSKYNFSNAVADVDGNGVVNMLDGIAVMKHYNKWSGFETLPLKK